MWRNSGKMINSYYYKNLQTRYKKEADDTGVFYSPMQRYLWDVRQSLTDLLKWCDARLLENMDIKTEAIIQYGSKVDEWNLERRRLVREVILSA